MRDACSASLGSGRRRALATCTCVREGELAFYRSALADAEATSNPGAAGEVIDCPGTLAARLGDCATARLRGCADQASEAHPSPGASMLLPGSTPNAPLAAPPPASIKPARLQRREAAARTLAGESQANSDSPRIVDLQSE